MRTLIGRAIVLERRDYKEADLKVLLTTDRFGHLYAVAPNAKKSRRRFVGGFNTFSLLEISADKKGDMYILNETTLIDENETAFENLGSFITASSLAEISERLFTLNNPDETAYYRLKFALDHLTGRKDIFLIFNFLRSLMTDAGEIPEFRFCAMCQGEIVDKRVLFNYFKGGILCRECSSKDSRGENISHNLYKLMLADEQDAEGFDESLQRQGIFLLERYLRFKLGITFRSFCFL
ncbi:MAG: DNA repair protein RecO [Deltaproteobacteria bacterium]|nr:DNA repair protein RecO [Deltaproteobacteria bacterium]